MQERYFFPYSLSTKFKFDFFNFDKVFCNELRTKTAYYENIINRVNQNEKLYSEYQSLYALLPDYVKSRNELPNGHILFRTYRRLEQKLCYEAEWKPVFAPVFILKATYTSPKGRNYYESFEEYEFSEMVELLNYVKKQIQIESQVAYQKKHERNLMTDKLRFQILQRDGFRCKLCGRSAADGVKLHVDHIIPIAKGGKTVPENLQTLCDKCNWGKSDTLPEDNPLLNIQN